MEECLVKLCSVEGCNESTTKKGMCETHYHRMWANGTLEIKTQFSETGLCTIEGCNEKHYAKGYCKKHYYKLIKQYPSKSNYIKKEKQIKLCTIKGCKNKHQAKGLCRKHYDQQRKLNKKQT